MTPQPFDLRFVKLVRDSVPGVVPELRVRYFAAGGQATTIKALKRKLLEEVAEYLDEPSADELADVLEVIAELARRELGLGTLRDLEAVAAAKANRLGGYRSGLGMFLEDARA